MTFRTPSQRRPPSSDTYAEPKQLVSKIGLTPVMEEMSHLRLTSTIKKSRDDFLLTNSRVSALDIVIPEWDQQESYPQLLQMPTHQPMQPTPPTALDIVRHVYADALGPGGLLVKQLEKRRTGVKQQPYSLSLISAISPDKILANQLVEGGVDSSVFENFMHKLLESIRKQEEFNGKHVVLLMDNATIHKHPMVIDTVLRMKAILLFNPQYSPHLNPVERYFKRLKKEVRDQDVSSR